MNRFPPLKPFSLKELQLIQTEFIRQSRAAAAGRPESMPWFDSLIPPWQGKLKAKEPAAIVEFGGSYLRLGVMISPDGQKLNWRLPVQKEKNVTEYPNTRTFIDWLADKTEPVIKKYRAAHLGFIYSHAFSPVKFNSHITGRPTALSKSFYIPDVIGKDIGKLLLRTLEGRGYTISRLAMLNDSVALVLCAQAPAGLIVATGANICGLHPRLKNLRNLEAGGFNGVPQNLVSRLVDLVDNPGHYLMEKQSSGKYQVELLAFSSLLAGIGQNICRVIIREKFRTGSLIVSLTARGNFSLFKGLNLSPAEKTGIQQLSRLILERSWQMWAAAIAAMIKLNQKNLSPAPVKIPVTGGVILNDELYFRGLAKTLVQLIKQPVQLIKVPDPIKGAAVAALID